MAGKSCKCRLYRKILSYFLAFQDFIRSTHTVFFRIHFSQGFDSWEICIQARPNVSADWFCVWHIFCYSNYNSSSRRLSRRSHHSWKVEITLVFKKQSTKSFCEIRTCSIKMVVHTNYPFTRKKEKLKTDGKKKKIIILGN